MFGLGKLQVLESKLDIYEDLSKEMLDKLERAVTTISENSNRVAIVLERHETRLDEGDKSNQLIIKMIEEMKVQEEKNHGVPVLVQQCEVPLRAAELHRHPGDGHPRETKAGQAHVHIQ